MSDYNSKINLLKKLQVMASRGLANESKVAKNKIEEISKKHNINLTQNLQTQRRRKRIFEVINWSEHKHILYHIVTHNYPEIKLNGIESEKKVIVYLNDEEYVKITSRFNFYWKAYTLEKELMCTGFILKNIMNIKSDTGEAKQEENEEADGILKFMRAIKSVYFIEDKNKRLK